MYFVGNKPKSTYPSIMFSSTYITRTKQNRVESRTTKSRKNIKPPAVRVKLTTTANHRTAIFPESENAIVDAYIYVLSWRETLCIIAGTPYLTC